MAWSQLATGDNLPLQLQLLRAAGGGGGPGDLAAGLPSPPGGPEQRPTPGLTRGFLNSVWGVKQAAPYRPPWAEAPIS